MIEIKFAFAVTAPSPGLPGIFELLHTGRRLAFFEGPGEFKMSTYSMCFLCHAIEIVVKARIKQIICGTKLRRISFEMNAVLEDIDELMSEAYVLRYLTILVNINGQ